ncbi:uncharacterized protein LOC107483914 [Arachis duranensis]|uniref:Uncharacterized protein LOC107483914 n=1 Tax=Arachis duranensis TaxID=130453 RepID=A0A6P4D0N7_ARADU|nr:uncharacterized protein LOC107483914 [Arachis duranensis]
MSVTGSTSSQPINPHKPEISFLPKDYKATDRNLDEPVVISTQVEEPLVKKILMDPGSSANVQYQRLMDKMFSNPIGRNIEVYVDDMVAKTLHASNHIKDLKEIFQQLRAYNMKLNPEKCAFGVQGGKFLGFMLTYRDIEANLEKCPAILNMRSPRTVKEISKTRKACPDLSNNGQTFATLLPESTIIVRTEQPLWQILTKPELAGRLIKWSIELSEYDIQYQPGGALKSQVLAYFITEFTVDEPSPTSNTWTLYIDGASNNKSSGAGILLEDEKETALEQFVQFTFHACNNQAEYEALIAELRLAHTIGVTQLNIKCDSLLVVQQVTGNFQVKNPLLEKYSAIVNDLVNSFQKFEISHIPREQNDRADILSKLAATRSQTKKPKLSQLTFNEPSVMLIEMSSISQKEDWRKPFIHYLQTGQIPENVQNKREFKRRASFYTLLGSELYKRGFTRLLLKCLNTADAKLAMDEVHEGVCGTHKGGRSLASKILRAGYYWPTLQQDCTSKVQHCDHCQHHVPIIHNPAEQLHSSEFSSVEHPQTNSLGEAANKIILQGLRKKLEDYKGEWAELIPEVLWNYNTTEQSSTKETPFRLVYGSDAMLPIEISLQSPKTESINEGNNVES